tara:strand:+ start:569 stop:1222 length:654 start_codon:yes stop_codon:yes gene_type:complete
LQRQSKIFSFFIIILIFNYSCVKKEKIIIQEGDLLFQDLDSSPLCDGIEQVTNGFNDMDFSHIGIVTNIDKKNYVLESFDGVDTVNLEDFLNRSLNKKNQPKVVVGRLQDNYQQLITNAISHGMSLIGLKYDDEFKIDNGKFYCSELIYEIFLVANNNKEFFELQPMTYKSKGKTLPVWENYFKKLNILIPENKPGINPGGISLSPKINIIYNYQED